MPTQQIDPADDDRRTQDAEPETEEVFADDPAELLALADRPIEKVFIPQWGRTVCLKALSAAEREDWGNWLDAANKLPPAERPCSRAELAVRCLCRPDGTRMFAPEDAAKLAEKNGAAVARISEAAMRQNAIGPEHVEALSKNSEGGPDGDSPSGSPATSDSPTPTTS